MALSILNAASMVQAQPDVSTTVSRKLTAVRAPTTVATPVQPIMSPIRSQVPLVPVIPSVRVPVGAKLPTAPVPMAPPGTVSSAVPTRVQTPVAQPVSQVIPNLDRFVSQTPVLSKRLPPATGIPTKQAEQAAMPSAGQKVVGGSNIAPPRIIGRAPVARPTVASPAVARPTTEHFKPSAPMTSNLSERVAQNPFDQAVTAGGAVVPPSWYVENYMHNWDKLPASGFGAVEGSSNWSWVLAAGLAVSAAWFWQASRKGN